MVVESNTSSLLLALFAMAQNLPRSSAMSPIPLFRQVTSESVSKGRSTLHKKLVQLFNQKTLIGSLISKKDQERMKKGKALLHVVGGKPTQCLVMETPTQIAPRVAGNQHKSGPAQSGRHSISPVSHPQASPPSPKMSSAGKESFISGQGPSLPAMGKRIVASTPSNTRKQEIRICGVSFGGEMKEARSIISANGLIEEIFLNLLDEYDDAERVLDVHESLETGDLEDDHEDVAVWMPIVAEYVKLVRATLARVSTSMTKEQQGAKIRLLVRPEGKLMKGLAVAYEKAQGLIQPETNFMNGSIQEEEKVPNLPIGGEGEGSTMPTSSAGEKRGMSAPSAQCPKLLRRSVSSTSLASESASSPEITEENIQDETSGLAPNLTSDSIHDAEKEQGEVIENARKSMMEYGRRISQSAVRSQDLDSDGEEEKEKTQSARFVDYPQGVGRAMAIGPIIPKTQEFIVVGPVPMGDSQAIVINKKMSNFAKAVADGDKGSKALTAFSPLEIQKNFAPGGSSDNLKNN